MFNSDTTKDDDKNNYIYLNKTSNEKIYNNVWRLIFFLCKRNYIIVFNFLLMILRGFINSRIPNTVSKLTEVVGKSQSWSNIMVCFTWSLSITLVAIVLRIISIYTDNKASIAIDKDLSTLTYNYVINQDYSYRHQLSTINFSINSNNLLRLSKAWTKFNRILYLFIELMFCLINLFFSGSLYTNIASVIFISSYVIFFFYAIPLNQKKTDNSIKSWNNLCRFINTTFNYLTTIHVFNREKDNSKEFDITLDDNNKKRNQMLNMKTIILGFVDLSFIVYQYTVIFLIVLAIFQQKMTLGFLTLFSILVYRVYHNLKEIIGEYKIIEDVSNYIESMNNLFFRPLISKETYNPNHLPLKPKNFNIIIKNLKFKGKNIYEDQYILNIKDLTFKEKEKYVIMGYSGCGKTSLVNLLIGLWDYHGKILLGDHDLKKHNNRDLREYINLTSQETTILPLTVMENIAYGNTKASIPEIEFAAKKACIHDFIMTLPRQYNTKLTEDGNLSGGQKQKIILARMFLSKAPIIILDESTSSLDIKTEAVIYENIQKYLKDKTVIIIAHRLGVLDYFNNIVLIDKGEVAANDNYENVQKTQPFIDFLNKFNDEGI
jgi:ABC-type bacteriocin/lantibiotic exporter with double-glycine peptidase domain